MDYFWSFGLTAFDPSSIGRHAGYTVFYSIHGGLHLRKDDLTGMTGKWINSRDGIDILDLGRRFEEYPRRRPLFVSEGSPERKHRTIRGSDYLSFTLE